MLLFSFMNTRISRFFVSLFRRPAVSQPRMVQLYRSRWMCLSLVPQWLPVLDCLLDETICRLVRSILTRPMLRVLIELTLMLSLPGVEFLNRIIRNRRVTKTAVLSVRINQNIDHINPCSLSSWWLYVVIPPVWGLCHCGVKVKADSYLFYFYHTWSCTNVATCLLTYWRH